MRLLLLLWGTSFITQILITTSNNASTEDATITKNNIWIERSYFTQGDSTANLWSNDYNIFNYDAVHLNKFSWVDLQPFFKGKTVLAVGDSTVRETFYHMIYFVNDRYPTPHGHYPPPDFTEDYDGVCKTWRVEDADKKACVRDWNLNGTRWMLEFIGHLTDERKTHLQDSLRELHVPIDMVVFGYSAWPATHQPGDRHYFEMNLWWLATFLRSISGDDTPIFWLGSPHDSQYEYQNTVIQEVLGFHQQDNTQTVRNRTIYGGMGAFSLTPIERYGLGSRRDNFHFHSPSYELFAQMIFNWFCRKE